MGMLILFSIEISLLKIQHFAVVNIIFFPSKKGCHIYGSYGLKARTKHGVVSVYAPVSTWTLNGQLYIVNRYTGNKSRFF